MGIVYVLIALFLGSLGSIALAGLMLLIKSGYSRSKAFFLNALSGATAIVFGVAAFYTLDTIRSMIPYALAFSASSFLYISLADLIPEMHRKTTLKDSLSQVLLILSGILIIYLVIQLK